MPLSFCRCSSCIVVQSGVPLHHCRFPMSFFHSWSHWGENGLQVRWCPVPHSKSLTFSLRLVALLHSHEITGHAFVNQAGVLDDDESLLNPLLPCLERLFLGIVNESVLFYSNTKSRRFSSTCCQVLLSFLFSMMFLFSQFTWNWYWCSHIF